jgi:D-alanyl-D-alanine carboxypeptidase
MFMALITAMAALSAVPGRAAPFAAHVMDARTGETLYAHNADTRLHPASLTKMMTLYIAFDAIRRGEIGLDTVVTVSASAAAKPPSRLGLRAGQKIALRHLIRAAAIKSANDAASAIGDALSGNEAAFARRMDRTAKALGMKSSTFRNANGLTEPGHLSTARDMSVLGRRLFYDFPEYYNIFSRQTAHAGVAQVTNTNNRFLAAYRGADGIKTGYTVAAGFNLTASAERDGKRLIATVFGGTSPAQRNQRIAELLDAGFAAAPRNVSTRKPAPLDLPAPEAAAVAEGKRAAAAKTIRLVTVLTRSPRPRPRPAAPGAAAAAEQVVAGLRSSIDAAVAAAGAAPADPPLPFQLVDPATLEPVEPPGPGAAAAAPEVGRAPFQIVDAVAAPPAPEAAPTDPVPLRAEPAAPPARKADAAGPGAPGPAPLILAAAPVAPLRPAPAADDAPPAAEPVIVTRMSTSGGRHWGVNLGRFAARAAAERVLVRTALAEGPVLGEGLRKVAATATGFDANILGLSEAQADLACRRLQARAQDCRVLGP